MDPSPRVGKTIPLRQRAFTLLIVSQRSAMLFDGHDRTASSRQIECSDRKCN
jgi:hypothetical protein